MQLKKVWTALTKRRRFCIPNRHHLLHAEHYTHMTYLGLVSFEAHGLYSKAAAVGFAISLASLFVHDAAVIEQAAEEL